MSQITNNTQSINHQVFAKKESQYSEYENCLEETRQLSQIALKKECVEYRKTELDRLFKEKIPLLFTLIEDGRVAREKIKSLKKTEEKKSSLRNGKSLATSTIKEQRRAAHFLKLISKVKEDLKEELEQILNERASLR